MTIRIKMKKEDYQNSKSLRERYGELKMFSESANAYKTDKDVVIVFEGAESPNFGKVDIKDINPTGDVEQDFNNAMVALRDDNYEAFVKDLNTLASDPKIDFLRDAIIDQFNSPDGVKVFFSKRQPLEIENIHPTQHEVDMKQSLEFPLSIRPEMIDIAFSGKPIIIKDIPLVVAEVDGTYYIIDGHHRWSQIYCLNPHAQMTVRIIKSDMFKSADDVLKLVQMQLFIAKDGGKLPQATVDSPYNLYTIDEKPFKEWCQKTMNDEARQKFAVHLNDKDDAVDYMWQNVVTMRKSAAPTQNAHGRGDMPQTDKVDGEYMKPTAQPVSESQYDNNNDHQYEIDVAMLGDNATWDDLQEFCKIARQMGYDVKAVDNANWRRNNECEEGIDYPTESEWMDILDSIITMDMVAESDIDDEESDEDGWNRLFLDDTGLWEVFEEIRQAEYEIRNCVKGCYAGCNTYQQLGDYLISLGDRLSSSGEGVKCI